MQDPALESAERKRHPTQDAGAGRLPFTPLGEALDNAPESPDWIWEGYLAPRTLTALASWPKVGKSTLAFGLMAAIEQAAPFLDRTTRSVGVALLSEEREDTLAEKQRRFGIAGRVELLMRHQVNGQSWPEIVQGAADHCGEAESGLLIVDTWDKWTTLRGDEENSAGAVVEQLLPLLEAARDLAVLIVTHQRKSGGRHGEAVRGSNALTGGVDIVVELERLRDDTDPDARVLRAESRYTATPHELVFRLDQDRYEACGDVAAVREQAERSALRDAVIALERPAEAKELAAAASETLDRTISEATARRRLAALVEDGALDRVGAGKRGDPYLFLSTSQEDDVVKATEQPTETGCFLSPLPIPWWCNESAGRHSSISWSLRSPARPHPRRGRGSARDLGGFARTPRPA
jgi:AAA domain-containing protein